MLVYIIDDEPIALRASEQVVRRALQDADLMTFGSGDDTLEHMRTANEFPDIVFSDIEMPGTNGLDFAVRLKQLSPKTRIVFVTAYSEYALDAFRVHANGYILKPMNAMRVLEEIAASMWEDNTNQKNTQAQLRILISDLRHTLGNIGMEDIVIRRRGQVAVMTDRLDCDYYHMLEGDMDAINAYHGEYMVQYSWAELTAGQLAWKHGRY